VAIPCIAIRMQTVVLFAQVPVKPKPTFTLSIEEDKDTARITPGRHRLRVKFTVYRPE
jgi:hypothetical protein